MCDGGTQAGQEVPLALLVVSPLDEHRLQTAAQQIGAWWNKEQTNRAAAARGEELPDPLLTTLQKKYCQSSLSEVSFATKTSSKCLHHHLSLWMAEPHKHLQACH